MPVNVYPWHQTARDALLQRRGLLPHALLFVGREGTGKLNFVRALAQSVLCATPAADGVACGSCQGCRWFVARAHPDYREIQPEALLPPEEQEISGTERKPSRQITIDQVRALADFMNLSAHTGGPKLVVISPAEALNANAANSLLKCLEEPPGTTRFMLVSHRPGSLPATIISRCQKVTLPDATGAEAKQWLQGQGVVDAGLRLAYAGNAPLAALDLDETEFWEQRKIVLDALCAPRLKVIALAERIQKCPAPRLLSWLVRWSYDLMIIQAAQRVRYNPDYERSLAQLAGRLAPAAIARFYRHLMSEQRTVQHPLNARLHIERLLLAYSQLLRGEREFGHVD